MEKPTSIKDFEEAIKLLKNKPDDNDILLKVGEYLASIGINVMLSKFLNKGNIIIGTGEKEIANIKIHE